jgi:hypothetical protein
MFWNRGLTKFRNRYIADRAVDLGRIAEYRNDVFPISGPQPWLDRPGALFEVERRHAAGELTDAQAEMCTQWIFDGYYIAPGLISADEIATAWRDYEKAVADGVVTLKPEKLSPEDIHPGRLLDPHMRVSAIWQLLHHPKVLAITDLLFGRKTLPFQTIMGHKGSSQKPHSDSIHMTTFPMGYLIANWIAFEDIHPDSGPREYYPRSHKLVPPLLSGDLGIQPLAYKEDARIYHKRYEPQIDQYIKATGLEPKYFMAKTGDVLFWHANLLHGGAPRKNHALSRKALVCHYFCEGVVTYHDLSGNLSRLHRDGVFAPPAIDPNPAA